MNKMSYRRAAASRTPKTVLALGPIFESSVRGGPSIGPGGVMMLGLPDRLLSRGTETVTA
ncbi:hypothetical protein MA20_32520 [Bradyrhizobium japonicum]|uniref:Uncharacterized protein n=1 Tax=Bradyrhizobium japonicum TaxID=375 RepID=A0A0A3XQ13_BRAJP|nr:hypothetical protein MA20_32520 [Bradyrhizobium japonicum]MCW2220748.1 hypothetical protein [Bradyrhizobium japonicum]MCW2345362.1 hypothetical protein [Bradyrhizobium japonicum]